MVDISILILWFINQLITGGHHLVVNGGLCTLLCDGYLYLGQRQLGKADLAINVAKYLTRLNVVNPIG